MNIFKRFGDRVITTTPDSDDRPAPPTGQLPAEAQILLRVMGEDLQSARSLLRDMSHTERAILLFYTEQITGLVYEVMAQEDNRS